MNRPVVFSRFLPLLVLSVLLLAACQPAAQSLPTATALPPLPTATVVPPTAAPVDTPVPAPTATSAPVTIATDAGGVPVTGSTAQPRATKSSMGDDDSDDYGGGDDSRKTPGTPGAVAGAGTVVNMSSSDALGPFLVDDQGMTLYLFTNDSPGQTSCFEGCLVNWPPLLTTGQPVAGEGVDDSDLGVITRPDGAVQVTYRDLPLYYFIGDTQPGATNGQGVGEVWFVVEP